jgi:hypothetical protein
MRVGFVSLVAPHLARIVDPRPYLAQYGAKLNE